MSEEKIQPEVNIGLVGHVDHGKSTLTQQLSGKWTDTHSEEMKRGITIRLGYADSEIRKCENCDKYVTEKTCSECEEESELVRKISIVDAPGHESLMATMISGSTIIDGAILLVSAAEECPQPQTQEHLMALQITGVENVIVVQNKIDLVSEEEAKENYEQIKDFLEDTDYEDAPIIPISARSGVNLDVLIDALQEHIPTPERNPEADPRMLVARSFDINKPGTNIENIKGGVLGGSLIQGELEEDEEIEIKPGWSKEEHNQTVWSSLNTKITGLRSGGESFEKLRPGGSIGVMTELDPAIVKSDSLGGSIVGKEGTLPPTRKELILKPELLDRVVGTEDEEEVDNITRGEPLMLNVNAAATIGTVIETRDNKIKCKLKKPVCAETDSKVTISRKIGTRFRLIGYGKIKEEI